MKRKLFLEHLSITSSPTYIHRRIWLQHASKKTSKLWERRWMCSMMCQSWKEHGYKRCSQACPRVFEATTEVSDDLLHAKSNEIWVLTGMMTSYDCFSRVVIFEYFKKLTWPSNQLPSPFKLAKYERNRLFWPRPHFWNFLWFFQTFTS